MKVLGFSDPLVPHVYDGSKTVTRRGLSALKRYKPGDICAIGEALVMREGLTGAFGRPRYAVYRRDSEIVPARTEEAAQRCGAAEWSWKPRVLAAMYCPAWAARGHVEILSVAAEYIHDALTDEEAVLEGARQITEGGPPWLTGWSMHSASALQTPDQVFASPTAAFFGYWKKLHRGKLPTPRQQAARIAFRLATVEQVEKARAA